MQSFVVFQCPHCEKWQAWVSRWYGRISRSRSCPYCCMRIRLDEVVITRVDTWQGARALVVERGRDGRVLVSGELDISPREIEASKTPNPITIVAGDICPYMYREKVPCPGPRNCSVSKTCEHGGAEYWKHPAKMERIV